MATTFILTIIIVAVFIASLSIGIFRGRGMIKSCAGSAHHPGEGCACRDAGLHDGARKCDYRTPSGTR